MPWGISRDALGYLARCSGVSRAMPWGISRDALWISRDAFCISRDAFRISRDALWISRDPCRISRDPLRVSRDTRHPHCTNKYAKGAPKWQANESSSSRTRETSATSDATRRDASARSRTSAARWRRTAGARRSRRRSRATATAATASVSFLFDAAVSHPAREAAMRTAMIMVALALVSASAFSAGTSGYSMTVLVGDAPAREYSHDGTIYVEALRGSDFAIRITNPTPYRVAGALSVDGLNTIDARHTDAWSARKWVLDPWESTVISGWQVDEGTARRFFFTGEKRSYGATLGKTENLGVIEAVFYRERTLRRREANVAPRSMTPRFSV